MSGSRYISRLATFPLGNGNEESDGITVARKRQHKFLFLYGVVSSMYCMAFGLKG